MGPASILCLTISKKLGRVRAPSFKYAYNIHPVEHAKLEVDPGVQGDSAQTLSSPKAIWPPTGTRPNWGDCDDSLLLSLFYARWISAIHFNDRNRAGPTF